ncbi:MAG: sulfatase-like hydrolase/transferase [Planctomycetota bacterium]
MANAKPPNIVIFFTDQQRWDSSGLHGCPLDLTPNFDRFAAGGTHLSQCITPQPVCGPARACLQTGRYATEHGAWSNAHPLDPSSTTLATLLGDAGYHTGYFGKWHLNGTGRGRDQAVCADRRLGYQTWLGANVLEFCSQPYRCTLYNERDEQVTLPGYRVDAVTDAAIRYIAERAEAHEPFLAFISILEPHHQNELFDYVPPHGYRSRYAGRWLPPDLQGLSGNAARHAGGYFGCIKRCDEAFGRVLDALESLNLRDTTNVVYTSDHGCHFGTRHGIDKRSPHESSVRVLGALGGADFDGRGRVDRPVSLVDIAPTLLRTAGVAAPDDMRGRALQDLLDLPAARRGDTDALVQFGDANYCPAGRALRTRRWKYAVACESDTMGDDGTATSYREACLYDLEHDPYELCNLVADKTWASTREALRDRLLERMSEIGEPACEILPPQSEARPAGSRY